MWFFLTILFFGGTFGVAYIKVRLREVAEKRGQERRIRNEIEIRQRIEQENKAA